MVETQLADDASVSRPRARLLLRIASEDPAHAAGVAVAAHALSGEVCALCGALGHPVRLAGTGARTTRCDGCRRPGDERLERPPWRRSCDASREAVDPRCSVPLVEDLIDDADLAALMEARKPAWPRVGLTDPDGVVWAIGADGWNGLLRAAFSVLLPLQCAGQARPFRLSQVKERLGVLVIHGSGFDALRLGVVQCVEACSRSVCIVCGRPGTQRLANPYRGGWIRSECDRCWATAPEQQGGRPRV